MIDTDGSKHVESTATGHVQIENDRIWLHFLNPVHRGGHIACLSYEPCAGDLLAKARQSFHDHPRVIGDKDFHLSSLFVKKALAQRQRMTNSRGNTHQV